MNVQKDNTFLFTYFALVLCLRKTNFETNLLKALLVIFERWFRFLYRDRAENITGFSSKTK